MSQGAALNLREAIAEFSKTLSKRQISDNTRKAFLGDVNIFARFITGEEDGSENGKPIPKLNEINGEHIRGFLAHEEKRKGANSPKSLERRLTSLKVFYDWLHDMRHVGFNPAEGIAYKPFQDPLPEYLSEAEQRRVIEAAKRVAASEKLDTRPWAAIALVLDTGMKKGECLKLFRDDIDLDQLTVLIRYDQPHLKFKNRKLPISPSCADALKTHFERYDIQGVLFDCTGRNLEYIFNRKVAPLAGLPALTFEQLRWSCAFNDYKQGALTTTQYEIKYGLSSLGWAEMEAKLARVTKA